MIANAVSAADTTAAGTAFLDALGIHHNTFNGLLPHFSSFQARFWWLALAVGVCLTAILCVGILALLNSRNKLYRQAKQTIDNYIHGDDTGHLPQGGEGELFRLLASVEELAMVLQAKNESGHKTKEFLKSTISDISHQLKTPLAAV